MYPDFEFCNRPWSYVYVDHRELSIGIIRKFTHLTRTRTYWRSEFDPADIWRIRNHARTFKCPVFLSGPSSMGHIIHWDCCSHSHAGGLIDQMLTTANCCLVYQQTTIYIPTVHVLKATLGAHQISWQMRKPNLVVMWTEHCNSVLLYLEQ